MSAYRILARHIGEPDSFMGGPFAVYAIRECDNRIVSSCTGIRTAAACEARAVEYHFSFGLAPITFGAGVKS